MSRKVLVVDDEKLIVKGVRFSLEQDGMEVDCAYDGEEALEKIQNNEYDIVLLDILMPPPTGFDVAAALASRQDPPAIIFTTKSDAYAIKGYGIAIRYLQKPLEERALFKALDVAIEDISARRRKGE